MPTVEQSINVNVDVATAYDQWSRFESFPQWMEGVASVEQTGDSHLHWVAKVRNEFATVKDETREWDARITEHTLDKRISWESVGGSPMRSPTRGRPRLSLSAIRRAASPSRWTGNPKMRSRPQARCSTQ